MSRSFYEMFHRAKGFVKLGEDKHALFYLNESELSETLDKVFEYGEDFALRGLSIEEQIAKCRFLDTGLSFALYKRKYNKVPSSLEKRKEEFLSGYAAEKPHGAAIYAVMATEDGVFLGFFIDGNYMLWINDTIGITHVDTSGDNNGAGYKGGEDDSSSLSLVLDPTLSAVTPHGYYCASESDVENGVVRVPNGTVGIMPRAFSKIKSNDIKEIILPEGVKVIERRAFEGCCSLTDVNLPSSLESIGVGAFKGCSSLESIVIPNGVTGLLDHTFSECSSLKSVDMNGVKSLGFKTFENCTSLTDISMESLEVLGEFSFLGCSSLALTELPEGMKHVGFATFKLCTSLRVVRIPNTVEEIDHFVFDSCDGLKKVILPKRFFDDFKEGMRFSQTSDDNEMMLKRFKIEVY